MPVEPPTAMPVIPPTEMPVEPPQQESLAPRLYRSVPRDENEEGRHLENYKMTETQDMIII